MKGSPNYDLLSFKQKKLLAYAENKGFLDPIDAEMIYNSRVNARNALYKLKLYGFLTLQPDGKFVPTIYREEQQKELEVRE